MGYADTYASNHAAILRDLGRSQAEAKLRSGDAWAGALEQIGQIAGNLPGQLADEKRQKAQQAIWDANLKKLQQQDQEDLWLSQAMNSSVVDGKIDERRLTENLTLLGATQLVPEAVKTIRESEAALVNLQNAQQRGQINEAELGQLVMGYLSPYAKVIKDSDFAPAVVNGALASIAIQSPQMAQRLAERFAENPQGIRGMVEELTRPTVKPPREVGGVLIDENEVDPATGQPKVLFDSRRPETPKIESLDDQLALAFKSGDRAKVNAIVKLQADIAAGKRAPERPGAPSYTWVTLPDGSQKFLTAEEIRATPGAAPPSASRAADAPASVKTDLASIGTLSDMLTQIETIGKKYNWDGIGGLGVGSFKDWMQKSFGTGSEEGQALRNTISNVLGEIAKLRGGTAFTAQEQQLLERYTPTINESPESVAGKVKSLREFLAIKRRNIEQQFMGGAQPTGGRAAGAGPAGSGGAFTVTSGGQTFIFPSQAALDAFKAKAGIK